MLRVKEFIYECEDYKIKNPDKETRDKISNEIEKYGGVEADIDNPKFILYLFEMLVVSENIDYQFDKYSLSNFAELLEDERAPREFSEMIFYISGIVSNIILDTMRAKLMQLKNLEIETNHAKILNEINKIGKEKDDIENENIEVNVEKVGFIDKILIKLGFKDV